MIKIIVQKYYIKYYNIIKWNILKKSVHCTGYNLLLVIAKDVLNDPTYNL